MHLCCHCRAPAEHRRATDPTTPPPVTIRLPNRQVRSHAPWTASEKCSLSSMVAQGMTDKQIASVLGRSELAVRIRREESLGLTSALQLVGVKRELDLSQE